MFGLENIYYKTFWVIPFKGWVKKNGLALRLNYVRSDKFFALTYRNVTPHFENLKYMRIPYNMIIKVIECCVHNIIYYCFVHMLILIIVLLSLLRKGSKIAFPTYSSFQIRSVNGSQLILIRRHHAHTLNKKESKVREEFQKEAENIMILALFSFGPFLHPKIVKKVIVKNWSLPP